MNVNRLYLILRETAADKKQDFQSLQRKLDQILYLLVKKPRQSYMWQMPQGGLDPGESLIQVKVITGT